MMAALLTRISIRPRVSSARSARAQDPILLGNVDDDLQVAPAQGLDLSPGRVQLDRLGTGEDEVEALAGQAQGDRSADASATSGHERHAHLRVHRSPGLC